MNHLMMKSQFHADGSGCFQFLGPFLLQILAGLRCESSPASHVSITLGFLLYRLLPEYF